MERPQPTDPSRAHKKQRMTKQRKQLFLEELARTGIFAEAARLASPHSAGGALTSFKEERERDPEFAAAWAEAVDHSTGIIERELFRRAVEGWDEPTRFGPVRKHSDRLIELIMKRRDSAYREHRKVEISGDVRQQQPSLDHLSDDDLRALKQLLNPCQDLGDTQPEGVTPTPEDHSGDSA